VRERGAGADRAGDPDEEKPFAVPDRREWCRRGEVDQPLKLSDTLAGRLRAAADNRVIFNIKGNHYRLVVCVRYQNGIVYIEWVGTHAEYSKRSFWGVNR
jgi:mRNA interferase HigB